MSGKAIRETFTALGVIASMVFVGWEIRQSNVQARAAAYQEIGIATAEWLRTFDDRLSRLYREGGSEESVVRWTLAEWDAYGQMVSDLRMLETVVLQVEQRLLPPEALERLGYAASSGFLSHAGAVCVWDDWGWDVGEYIGVSTREFIEASTPVGTA